MIFTPRFVILLALGGIMIGFSGWLAALLPAGAALASATVAAAVLDWARLQRSAKLEVERVAEEKLSLGAQNPIRLRIRNESYSRITGLIRDEYPEGFHADGNVMPFSIAPRSEWEAAYHTTPPRRGDYQFGDIYLRTNSSLGLVIKQMKYPMRQQVKVYPNLLDLRSYEIELKKDRALQPGQRMIRLYGRGTEFESLRDYQRDDEFRSVDWKASARRSRLVTRQYQEERSQNVMIVLDCGRIMGPVIDDLTRLDHAINAAMMLAHVAVLKGDKVGLMAFGEDIISYAPPKSGKSQTLNLLRLTYDLREADGDSYYYRAIPYLTRRWTRRSLVVVFTDLTDPESSKPLISQISGLTRKHLCLCVVMSDPALRQTTQSEPMEPADAYRAAAARQVLEARRQAAAELARAGAVVIDVPPGKFTPAVVNEYLNVKASAKL